MSFSTPQINGIALDNKSVTECEALLRSCRDSLSLSLMKVGHTLSHFLNSFLLHLCQKSSRAFFLLLHALHSSFTVWFVRTELSKALLITLPVYKNVHLVRLILSSVLATVLPS